MSIDRDTFENTSEEELADPSVPDRVLGFLATNADRAFEARKIAARIDVDEGAVSTALSRLKDRGLVEHKATYWAVTDDPDRLAEYSGYRRATALFNDQLGEEDEAARPWLVLSNHEGRPFYGKQYIAVTLTTRSWMDGLGPIPEDRWLRRGTPETSRIVPWGVQSIDRAEIDTWQGRIDDGLVDEAVSALVDELQ